MSNKNIANFAVDLIVEMGSRHVFTLTGGMAMFINRAVVNNKKLNPIYCQHEQACVAAAEGYSKTHNFKIPGFAVVTAGPGVSNTITSLISAYGDSTPLIVLAGQIKTEDIDIYNTRTHGIQEIHSEKIISPIVKSFVRITKNNFKDEIINAISVAISGRPGPVFIEIPLDVQSIPIKYDLKDVLACKVKIEKNKNKIDTNKTTKIKDAFSKLLNAKKPLLYFGNGCRIAGVEKNLLKFARKHQIPCLFSWLSFDILPAEDNLNFGCPGGLAPIYSNKILFEADIILFLGARLDLGTTAFQRKEFGAQAHRFFIDVDLNELKKFEHFNNSTPIQFNLKNIKSILDEYINNRNSSDNNWIIYARQIKKDYFLEEEKYINSKKLNVYLLAKLLSKKSSNKVFIPASSGYSEETFTRFFKPSINTRFFNGAALGSMGLGLPHAIGASCATDQQVICLEADGGIMLNLQELATLKQLNPKNFILIILNNFGYESIRSSQKRHFNFIYGADKNTGLYIPDFKKIAKSFEINYKSIDTLSQIKYIDNIISKNKGPVIIDIKIDKEEYRGPSVKTILLKNGKISSTPLNDLKW